MRQPGIEWVSTDFNRNEVAKTLKQKGGLSAEDADDAIRGLPVFFVPRQIYQNQLPEADALIGHRDKKDVPAVALALTIPNDGIWTSDKHFDQITQFRIWTSRKLLENWENKKT